MKTIWKFRLPVRDESTVTMPTGAHVLTVQEQAGQAYIWALVDVEAPKEERGFIVHGTGHPVDTSRLLRYVGTFQLHGGQLVFHVWERS